MVCIIPYMVWLRVNTGYPMFKQSFHKIIEVNDCRKLIGFSKSESLRAPSHINFAPGVKKFKNFKTRKKIQNKKVI